MPQVIGLRWRKAGEGFGPAPQKRKCDLVSLPFFGHNAPKAVCGGPALWLRVLCLLIVSAIWGGSAGAALAFEDEFDAGKLETGSWCPCQINIAKAPVIFLLDPDEAADQFAEVTVNEASLGGNLCRSASPDYECGEPMIMAEGSKEPQLPAFEPGMHALLGPGFLRARTLAGAVAIVAKNGFCTDEVMKRVEAAREEGECIQRQELRLRRHLWHDAGRHIPTCCAFAFEAQFEARSFQHAGSRRSGSRSLSAIPT